MSATSGRAHFRYDGPDSGIAVMSVEASRHRFPKHSHESYYIIGLMEEGASYCYGPEQEESLAAAGDLFVINPGQVHSGVPAGNTSVSYRMLSINRDRFASLGRSVNDDETLLPEFPMRFKAAEDLCRLIRRTYALLDRSSPQLLTEETILDLVAELLPHASRDKALRLPPFTDHPGLRRAEELLSLDLEENLDLSTIAAEAALSPYHFIRSFKRSYGLSPHKYRTQKRIGAAKAMLRQGVAAAEVAQRLGFYDQSHFSNAFHSYTGLTPRGYASGT